MAMLKRGSHLPFPSPYQARFMIRNTVGSVICMVGLADMLSAIVPRLNWDILLGAWPIVPHRIQAQTLTGVVGFFLIMLSYGLARAKKHALHVTVVLLALSSLLHVLRSGSVLATLVALLLTMLLGTLASFFRAKSDPPSVWRGYIALGLGLGVVTFYTIGGFLALYDQFAPFIERFGFEDVVLRILTHAHMHATPASFFERALPVLCVSAVLYGMAQLFRPVAAVLLPNREKRHRATELVRFYGKNSISYFALDSDKSYFFSQSGRVVISYVLEGSTAVVAGDPIGPEDEIEPALKQFIEFCREQDWTIVFWQVRAGFVDLYRASSLHLLKIGEDAVVDAQNFTLKGGAMANVRSSAKRAEKDGLRVVFYRGQVDDLSQLAQMEQISRAWLASKGGSEMGFSMGRFDVQGDDEQVYALAVDANNNVYGFMSFVPIYGRKGWGIDLMRRKARIPVGTMELLIVRSMEYLKARGAEIVSLGLAPMCNINHSDETFLEYGIDILSNFVGDLSKKASLCNFKKKFQPSWESRYLVYSSTLRLPKAGWAIYRAHQRNVSVYSMAYRAFDKWRADHREARQKIGMVGRPNGMCTKATSTGELAL